MTAIARAGEPDRYLAALLAPASQREALVALAAFSAELSRIPLAVREPAMGEIRLQWWRDAVALPSQLRTGHPVADAVRAAARMHSLPVDLLEMPIDGRSLELGDGTPLGVGQLGDLLSKTEGALFALAARVVGLPATAELDAACSAAGYAYGLPRLLFGSRTGKPVFSPKAQLGAGGGESGVHAAQIHSRLVAARHFTAKLSRRARIAFLPLALVEPYLRALERSGPAPWPAGGTPIAPLSRVSRIAGAHLLGRL